MTVSSLNEARVAATLTPSLPFPSLFSSSWPSSASPAATRQQQLFCHAATCKFVDRSNSYPLPLPLSLSLARLALTVPPHLPLHACIFIFCKRHLLLLLRHAHPLYTHREREQRTEITNKGGTCGSGSGCGSGRKRTD